MRKHKFDIKNLVELKARQAAIKAEYTMEGEIILQSSRTHLKEFSFWSLLKAKPKDPLKPLKVDGKINIAGKVMSLALPYLINKTLFRNSGFITKALVGLVSVNIGKRIDGQQLGEGIATLTSWFKKKKAVTKPYYRQIVSD